MKRITIALLLLLAIGFDGLSQGVNFMNGTWAEIQQKAQDKGKMIFLDFYTDWCGPCKLMDRDVYPDQKVGKLFNEHFISYKIDAEKGEGVQLASHYKVGAYPTLLFLHSKGDVLFKAIGFSSPVTLMAQAKIAITPGSDYAMLKEKFDKDLLGKDDFRRYLILIHASGNEKETSAAFDTYIKKWPEISVDVFQLMKDFISSPSDSAFVFLEKNREKFSDIVGKASTEQYTKQVYLKDFSYSKFSDTQSFEEAKKKLKQKVHLNRDEELELDLNQAISAKDLSNLLKIGTILIDSFYNASEQKIGNLLGTYLMMLPRGETPPSIVEQWAKKAVSLKANSINLFQLGVVYIRQSDELNGSKYFDKAEEASIRDNDGLIDRIKGMRKNYTVVPSVRGVKFYELEWSKIKELASQQQKPIFIDFYTEWCAPCKLMLKEVLSDSVLGEYYNSNLVSIKVDAEKGEGIMLAKKYQVGGFPTYLFVNSNEQEIFRVTGTATISQMIDYATASVAPKDYISRLQSKLHEDQLSKEEMFKYFKLVKNRKQMDQVNEIIGKWISKYPKPSDTLFLMISESVTEPSSRSFQYLVDNKKSFYAAAGIDAVDKYIHNVYLKDFRYNKKFPNDSTYLAAKHELTKQISVGRKLDMELDFDYYQRKKDESHSMKIAMQLFRDYYNNDPNALSLLLGGLFDFVEQSDNLKLLQKWAQRSVDLQASSVNYFTLAVINLKLRDEKKAEEYFNKAKEISQQDNDGYYDHIVTMQKLMMEKFR